jgi:uroporphyrin-3 C-methyltransferase
MTNDSHDTSTEADPHASRAGGSGLAAIAIFVALVALCVAGWSAWRQHRAVRAEQAMRKQDAATIASMQNRLAAGDQKAQAGDQRLGKLQTALDDLRSTTLGLDRRIATLETAYASLSGQQQSAHDTVLLNDAEMLLRLGAQRYTLFHDANGALQAYSQAIEALSQVQNPAYAPVRASATTERDALAAAAPPARQAALDILSGLRGKVASLPLASAEATAAATATSKPGFWSRVGHAFGGIVKVSRDDGEATPLADARFARETLALNLAQAQEGLLAFDDAAYRAALGRADATLSGQFSPGDAAVRDARTQIANLLSQRAAGPAPRLGGALAQLVSVRDSQSAASPPATASTAGSTHR